MHIPAKDPRHQSQWIQAECLRRQMISGQVAKTLALDTGGNEREGETVMHMHVELTAAGGVLNPPQRKSDHGTETRESVSTRERDQLLATQMALCVAPLAPPLGVGTYPCSMPLHQQRVEKTRKKYPGFMLLPSETLLNHPSDLVTLIDSHTDEKALPLLLVSYADLVHMPPALQYLLASRPKTIVVCLPAVRGKAVARFFVKAHACYTACNGHRAVPVPQFVQALIRSASDIYQVPIPIVNLRL